MAKQLSLAAQIQQRKKQAEDRGISSKAYRVARYLGLHVSLDDRNGTSGNKYTFVDSNFKIEHRNGEISGSDGAMGFVGLDIHYKLSPVFVEGGGTLYTYIPGKWEKELDALQAKAEEAQKLSEKRKKENSKIKQQEKEKEERKKWGL